MVRATNKGKGLLTAVHSGSPRDYSKFLLLGTMALERLKQEDLKFEVDSCCIGKLSPKAKPNTNIKQQQKKIFFFFAHVLD